MDNEVRHEERPVVPRFVFETTVATLERTIKRLWILLIILVVLLVGSNVAWIVYESQFVEEECTYEATTDEGGTAIANGSGEVNYYGDG